MKDWRYRLGQVIGAFIVLFIILAVVKIVIWVGDGLFW